MNYFVFIFLSFILFAFTFFIHIKDYNSKNYPRHLVGKFYSETKWPPNIKRPLEDIAKKVKSLANKNQKILFNIDGAFLYYLSDYNTTKINSNDLEKMTRKSRCKLFENVKLFITLENEKNLCKELFLISTRFKDSKIIIFESIN